MTVIFVMIFVSFTNAQDTIYFKLRQSNLNELHKKQLKKSIQEHDAGNIKEVTVLGYSDTVGSFSFNEKLSRKRAKNTAKFLISKGVSKDLIKTKWLGETNKFDANNVEQNRCVEIVFKSSSASYKPIPEFYEKSQVNIQIFKIHSDRDTIIIGKQGTVINIPGGSFSSKNGKISNSTIDFQLKEVFLKSDMVLENLTTVSNDKILETQGMVYTNALFDGDTLRLQKDIAIMTPTDTIRNDAQIFDGARDLHSDVMNWSISNNTVLRNFTINDITKCPIYFPGCGGDGAFNDSFKRCDSLFREDYDKRLNCRKRALFDFMCGGVYPEYCKFFFCKIKKFFNGIKRKKENDKAVSKASKKLDEKLNELAKKVEENDGIIGPDDLEILAKALKDKAESGEPLTEKEKNVLALTEAIQKEDDLIRNGLVSLEQFASCNELEDLMNKYGVKSIKELMLIINRPLLDEFGVTTMEALMDTLPKVNLEKIEVAYKGEKIGYEDYKFYVFNSSNLGWKNVDIFADISEEDMISLKVSEAPSEQVDVKLVFVDREFVLPGKIVDDKHFYFSGIPKNESAWLVGVKYIDGKPLLALKNITTVEKVFDLEFKSMSLPDLKKALKVIDFKPK